MLKTHISGLFQYVLLTNALFINNFVTFLLVPIDKQGFRIYICSVQLKLSLTLKKQKHEQR